MNSRRDFLMKLGMAGAGVALTPSLDLFAAPNKEWFQISLAQWSLNRTIRKGELSNLDFPAFTAERFGIYAVEYVNSFFKDKAQDMTYLKDLRQRASDHGVKNVLIMIDGEGSLGDSDESKRMKAVTNHYKWIDAAQFLGCHAIRVNAAGEGSKEEVGDQVVKSLSTLADYGKDRKISVIVENHGGYSSLGDWLSDVLRRVNKKNCGSLPDFGNFYEYDRYQGVEDLMPFAKGVSAKANEFDNAGNEKNIDYEKMLGIVKKAGYKGYIGIEYEGNTLGEVEGILATKALLQRYQTK